MEEIRGKTLKEWKDYCKSDNVPIMTMKYITYLEERIEQLTLTDVSQQRELLKVLEYTRQVNNNPKEIQLLVDRMYLDKL